MLRAIGNIIWLALGGLPAALAYVIAGMLLIVPIITIPLAVQAFKLARYTAWPFGSRLVSGITSPLHGVAAVIANILWFPFGLVLAAIHVVAAAAMAVTIIGIPFAWAHLKLAGVSLVPFGFRVVDISELEGGYVVYPIG